MYTIINGSLVPAAAATILVSDLAVQRGYGVFDYFLTANYQPLFLEDHLDRFLHSASVMRLSGGLNRGQLKTMIGQLIEKNNIPGSGIRVTLTGGYSTDGYQVSTPNLIITQQPFNFNAANFDTGISLITHEYQRQLPEVKTIDYLMAIYLQPYITANSAGDVLYYANNAVTECPRSNFFLVTQQDEIITPEKNVLKGITRKRILALDAFNVKETSITPGQLSTAKEAFITSTTKKVLPVVTINGHAIGNGKPGPISRSIYNMLLG